MLRNSIGLQVNGNNIFPNISASNLQCQLEAEQRLSLRPKTFAGPGREVQLESLSRLACVVGSSTWSSSNGRDWKTARHGPSQGHIQLLAHPASRNQPSLSDCGELVIEPLFADAGSQLTLRDRTRYLMDALTISEGLPDYICSDARNLEVGNLRCEWPMQSWL